MLLAQQAQEKLRHKGYTDLPRHTESSSLDGGCIPGAVSSLLLCFIRTFHLLVRCTSSQVKMKKSHFLLFKNRDKHFPILIHSMTILSTFPPFFFLSTLEQRQGLINMSLHSDHFPWAPIMTARALQDIWEWKGQYCLAVRISAVGPSIAWAMEYMFTAFWS